MKRLGISLRKNSLTDPNNDLSIIRKGLLLLKQGDGMWVLRTFYWVILLIAVSSPFIAAYITRYSHSRFLSSQTGQAILGWGSLVIDLVYAQVLRSDVLSRRAWEKMNAKSGRTP